VLDDAPGSIEPGILDWDRKISPCADYNALVTKQKGAPVWLGTPRKESLRTANFCPGQAVVNAGGSGPGGALAKSAEARAPEHLPPDLGIGGLSPGHNCENRQRWG
jgi:hypothetical protein